VCRADHGSEIAAKIVRISYVQRQHIEDVLAELARLVELDWRNAQAFLPDFGGARIIGTVRCAADVALMRAHYAPEQPASAVEHRHERSQVWQMTAAVIGSFIKMTSPGATSLK